MAKKKLTHQSKQEAPQPQPQPQPQRFTMDDTSEKLHSLRNLNSLLLKETAQRRQQVESLVEANKSLESAFNRSTMQHKLLKAQLSNTADDNAVLEFEKVLAFVFIESQIREMGFRFGILVAEKNDMEHGITQRGSEVVFLKEKLLETENRERKLLEEVQKLRLEGEKLVEEGHNKERAIREVMEERDLALRSNAESAMVIDKLRAEMGGVMREKDEILKLNNAQEVKINGMELELKSANECLYDSHKEEELVSGKVLELEGRLGLALKKEEWMILEIRELKKQKEEMEGSIEMLKERRDGVQKVLDMVQKELEDKQHRIDEMVRDKNEIEKVKVSHEAEIVELQKEVIRLRDVVSELNESCRGFEEKNRELLFEVNSYRNSVDEVMVERDNIRKGFDEEKNKVKSLVLQAAGMEDKIEEMAGELDQMRSERKKVVEKNEMMESRVGVLMNEKDVLQRSLLEAQRGCDDLRAEIEFSRINSNQALAMLKSTAALVCQYEEGVEEVVSNEQKPEEEEIRPYAEQLKAIRDAFRGKNKMMADMKQQLELLQKSVAQAQKMKSLWTVISSATSILAAALAAYVAKGH